MGAATRNPETMPPTRARIVAIMALLGGVVACGGVLDGVDCILGPCVPTGGQVYLMTFVTGFPASRVVGSVGYLAPGDTVRLTVIRVSSDGGTCNARDTVRDSVRWGVSDPNVATITATPDGQGLLRARAAGAFKVIMLVGGTTPITPALGPQYISICPGGGLVGDFRVAP